MNEAKRPSPHRDAGAAEEAKNRERTEGNAGRVQVERKVRPMVIDGIWPSLMKKWQNQRRPYR